MASDRKKLRGKVLAEGRRDERFFRVLLDHLGFRIGNVRFETAPRGRGDAKAWVRAQYAAQVELLRRKRHQRLFLLAVRDGDNVGFAVRKADLDNAAPRRDDEPIAIPVPTWSIETWLLALLGDEGIEEDASRKLDFERCYPGKAERQALRDAARAWRDKANGVPSLPSLADGNTELTRIDLP